MLGCLYRTVKARNERHGARLVGAPIKLRCAWKLLPCLCEIGADALATYRTATVRPPPASWPRRTCSDPVEVSQLIGITEVRAPTRGCLQVTDRIGGVR
jgi:hypothetical protein